MKLLDTFKKMSNMEMLLGLVFILFIILPVDVPMMLANVVDSSIGMVVLFALAVYMFTITTPVLAVLFVFVAYELLRRSCKATGKKVIMKHTPTQEKKDEKMKKMNPVKKATLEEEIVDKMAPVGRSDMISYITTTFSPVAEDLAGASLLE
jgi:predicted membrane protein|tara:strand:+ start:2300 stop:2752 length:453 start_codon:yes stop_codon:yes gene_type:complete